MMVKIDFNELVAYGLRSQLAYTLSQPEWHITEALGWRQPTPLRLTIEEISTSQVNTVIEVDDANRTQWIAVRGSSNLKNWMLNFQYMQRPFDKNFETHRVVIDLHTGFYVAADDVYRAILPHLKQNYKTRLTGHSLGGAIAVILMMFLKEDGYQIDKCITFGQPKITDKRGALQCQHLPLLRVVNHEDVVPFLPPRTLLTRLQGSYHHFGAQVTLQHGRGYAHTPAPHLDPQVEMTGFWRNLWQIVTQDPFEDTIENVKDHDLNLYLLNLMANLNAIEDNLTNLRQIFATRFSPGSQALAMSVK